MTAPGENDDDPHVSDSYLRYSEIHDYVYEGDE